MNPHKFRHSAATNMIRSKKVDVKTVSGMLGHSRTSVTTDFYLHCFDDYNADATETLAELYGNEEDND